MPRRAEDEAAPRRVNVNRGGPDQSRCIEGCRSGCDWRARDRRELIAKRLFPRRGRDRSGTGKTLVRAGGEEGRGAVVRSARGRWQLEPHGLHGRKCCFAGQGRAAHLIGDKGRRRRVTAAAIARVGCDCVEVGRDSDCRWWCGEQFPY